MEATEVTVEQMVARAGEAVVAAATSAVVPLGEEAGCSSRVAETPDEVQGGLVCRVAF